MPLCDECQRLFNEHAEAKKRHVHVKRELQFQREESDPRLSYTKAEAAAAKKARDGKMEALRKHQAATGHGSE